ncbi:MAG TPA: asparagine synthase-related protein [Patescibacteria group bacterium]|nr:asparagine synthase-related protein [Patescibacteria group bacterium]
MLFPESEYSIDERNIVRDERPQQLRQALKNAVASQPVDALLLSGGIDSGMLAALDPQTPAITVVLENQGVDLRNAQRVVNKLGITWYPIEIDEAEASSSLNELISLTHSYDPGILNDIPIYVGLKYAASRGMRTIRTEDAADTLFAGYTYLYNQPNFRDYLRSLIPQIRLSSSQIGKLLGLNLKYPYLHPDVLNVAMSLDLQTNLADVETDNPGDFMENVVEKDIASSSKNKRWGKIVLRKAAQGLLPTETIWRTKTDLEFGSGTYTLEDRLKNEITDQEINDLRSEGKHFWNRMHAALYMKYKRAGLEPTPPQDGEYTCSWCGGGVITGRRHCHTCGGYPSNQYSMTLFEGNEL